MQAGPITRQTLLRMPFTAQVFDELVNAYLATGIGVAGMQPKIIVPDRRGLSGRQRDRAVPPKYASALVSLTAHRASAYGSQCSQPMRSNAWAKPIAKGVAR